METVIFGNWQGQEPRADVRRMLASRLCDMAAFSSEKNSDGSWAIFSSTHERLGTVRVDSQALTVSCVSR